MKKLFVIFFTLFILTGCSAGPSEISYQQISMKDAMKRMAEEPSYLLLDVRTPEEFFAGHIPGAINVPNEQIGEEEPTELPNKEELIYVYCRSGNRSKQASEKLARLGYRNIVEIGGINDYHGEVEFNN